jgi:hypothetical protein
MDEGEMGKHFTATQIFEKLSNVYIERLFVAVMRITLSTIQKTDESDSRAKRKHLEMFMIYLVPCQLLGNLKRSK